MIPAERASAGRRLDGAGIALATVSVAWTAWTGRSSFGGALPVMALQVACAATYAAARLATRWRRHAAPLAALAVGGTLAVIGIVVPGRGALGYGNADAALEVQLVVAALMVCRAPRPGRASWAAGGLAGGFAVAAALSLSVTAVVALSLLVVLAVGAAAFRAPAAAGLGLAAVLVVVGAAAATGVARANGAAPVLVDRIGDLVDDRRVDLWADAAGLAHDHPLSGAGAGRFENLSATALTDRDARWAHSDFLQQGAEGGAVALALLLAAFGWGFARLWTSGADGPYPALGSMALAALGVHAAVDYVLRFPVLTLACVALVGAATTPVPDREAESPG